MIYKNFVELNCLMIHAKFQNRRPPGSVEEDFKVFFFYGLSVLLKQESLSSYS